MHETLSISNFKCFSKKTDVEFGKISVYLGCNSVGKSSIIQSCILIRQIFEKAIKGNVATGEMFEIELNDEYGLQLGDSEKIMSSNNLEDIYITIDNLEFILSKSPNSKFKMNVKIPKNLDTLRKKEGLFSECFYYLNAERLGPRNYHIIDGKAVNNCGVYGENTIYFYDKVSNNKVDRKRCFNLDKEKKVRTVSKQVEFWMDYIIPGISIKADSLTDLRLSKLLFSQVALDTGFLSPHSFGFGISYVLPIIVTGLTAEAGSVFIVENPEAHLHPKGQSHIGYFLAIMAFAGVQVIIETHSEHVLNGIRIAALREKKEPDDIAFNFFSITNEGGKGSNSVDRVILNKRMDITNWPDGFMDQEEQDLKCIRYLRRK